MAAPTRNAGYMPAIRCSSCGYEIALEMMAEHVCSNTTSSNRRSPEVIPFRGQAAASSRDASGRGPRRPMQLPKIDPYAANRPGQYPYPGELTPASSGRGSQVVSPRSDSSSSFKGQWPLPHPSSRKTSTPAVRGPPSPELMSQDCAFPPFPIMPKPRSGTPNSDSDGETLRKPSYPKSNLSSPRGSTHTTTSTTSKSRSRRASTSSSKSTSKSRSRAKTVEAKQEPAAAPPVVPNMKRRPSLSNLFGMRKAPTEKMPPLPSSVPSVPAGRKGSKDDQPPLQPVVGLPASAPSAPLVTHDMQEQLQGFDFQVPGPADSLPSLRQDSGKASRDRSSVASSVYEDTSNPGMIVSPASPISEEDPEIKQEGKDTLSRLDGPSNATSKEPSYKAKRPAPIDSNLAIGAEAAKATSPKRSPTFPFHNTDRKTGNGPNGIMGRRPSDSSLALSPRTNFPLSPIRTGTFPPNSIGNLRSPRPVPSPAPAPALPITPASIEAAPTDLSATAGVSANFHRVSMDSASSYGSDTSLRPSRSSQSSPPRDEARREIMDMTRESRAMSPFITDMPPPLRPQIPRMQTDSPTDPLFQNGLLSSIPPSPSANTDTSPGLASYGFDFRESPSTSAEVTPDLASKGFDFRPRQMSSAGEERPKQVQSRHVPQRSQTVGANKGTCRGCNKIIASNQKSVSSADGRLTGKYHKECFVCVTCKSPFATADFYVLSDHPYCAHHYHELNGTLCAGCGKGIEGQYLESNTNKSPESVSRKFHPSCLMCATCRCQLRDDYFECNGKVYCERDAFRAASPHASRSQYDTAPSRPSPLSQGMLRADSEAGAKRFPERRTTKLMMMGADGLNVL